MNYFYKTFISHSLSPYTQTTSPHVDPLYLKHLWYFRVSTFLTLHLFLKDRRFTLFYFLIHFQTHSFTSSTKFSYNHIYFVFFLPFSTASSTDVKWLIFHSFTYSLPQNLILSFIDFSFSSLITLSQNISRNSRIHNFPPFSSTHFCPLHNSSHFSP